MVDEREAMRRDFEERKKAMQEPIDGIPAPELDEEDDSAILKVTSKMTL